MEQGSAPVEVRRRKKNGEVIRVAMALSMIHDDSGEAAGMLARLSPLAEPLSEQDKVHLHARIIEDSDQGVLITDAHERIVSINGAFTRITGYTPGRIDRPDARPAALRRARRRTARQGARRDAGARAVARRDRRQAQERRAVSAIGDDQRGARRARRDHPHLLAVFRHQRAQGRRSAHAAHGQLRQPDRAAQPQPVQPPGRPDAQRSAPRQRIRRACW